MKAIETLFFAILLVSGPIYAATTDDPDLLKVLLDNGTITQQQYEQLTKKAAEKDAQRVDVNISTNGGIRASTYDGKFTFQLGALLATDLAIYRENKNPLGNGTEIRNARIELQGTLYSNWDYGFSIDFADAAADIKDAFLTYRGMDPLSFSLGHFKVPFSLEEMTSRRSLTFMERALPNALVPGRRLGAGAQYQTNFWTAAAGIFGESFDEDVVKEGDEGWLASGRFTFSPIHSEKTVLHFGGSAAYQVPDDEGTVKIKTDPESHLTSVSFLNTGKIKNVHDNRTYGIESVIVYGPFSLQGEFIRSSIGLTNRSDTPVFQGGYAFASWILTGESRHYQFRRGTFGRLQPDRTWGAVELAVRYSSLNLTSLPLVSGGRESNVTAALNWYFNRNIRFMANYVLINNDYRATDNAAVLANDNPGAFQARVQIGF